MIGGLVSVLGRHFLEIAKIKAYAAGFYAAAGASLVFALAFALVSLRHWIVVTYGSQYPDLWVALVMFVLAAILVGVGVLMGRREPESKPMADLALLAGPPTARFALRRLSPRTVAVGIVLVAGLMLGRRMTHRAS